MTRVATPLSSIALASSSLRHKVGSGNGGELVAEYIDDIVLGQGGFQSEWRTGERSNGSSGPIQVRRPNYDAPSHTKNSEYATLAPAAMVESFST